jgi:hypothetical protein
MTKKLNVDTITNELEGSVFFPGRSTAPETQEADSTTAADEPVLHDETASRDSNSSDQRPVQAQTSQPASTIASNDDSMLARDVANAATLIESIRKTVKTAGKEVSFMRLTPHEKAQLADIVYVYKRQGTKTSENEINRIAINFLLADYKENGAASVLAQVIEALRA